MASTTSPFKPAASQSTYLNWQDKRRFQRQFTAQAVRSYVFLSLGMGVVAFLLPIALVVFGGYAGHYSISHFYWVPQTPRNIMVGALWATGVFLILFHGLSKLENWTLNIAGVAAISIAMNPMADPKLAGSNPIHNWSAILFFACIAFVAVFLSKGRTEYIIYPPKRRRFERAYTLAGMLMIAMPVAVAALHWFGKADSAAHWVFWVETLGIWAFAAYWFVKTWEYRLLLGIR
jgi:hypothetical protein